ncbi:beta-2 adrenergic receptor-like [Haliotis asinina]|uniref:beta-2 adrenergic receptor-like n=1 Tax=Haliotis asinina TaxID=109174 RepID=UPI003531CD8D
MELLLGSIQVTLRHNLGILLLCDVLIIFLNLMVIALIFMSERLRNSTKHMLVVNLAFADLLIGAIVIPLYAHYGVKGEWQFPCSLRNALTVLQMNILPSVTTLCVFVINMDYVFGMGCYFYTNGKTKYVMSGSMGLLPWVISGALLVPLYFIATEPGRPYDVLPCVRRYKEDVTALLLIAFSFFPQSFIIMVTGIAAVIGYLIKRRSTGLDMFGERIHSPVDISLVSFITILFYTPYFCLAVPVNRISCSSSSECDVLHTIGIIASWLFVIKSFVVPLCWFCSRDFRTAFRNICCWCCC